MTFGGPTNWIQTFSGKAFHPLNPKVEEVCIEDIAHALSQQCRYTGHTHDFYSVAEHSIYVAMVLPTPYKLWGLLHDASEAYVADIARPLKPYLTNYLTIEETIMRIIAEKFHLDWPIPKIVHAADMAVFEAERKQVIGEWVQEAEQIDARPVHVHARFLRPKEAEIAFLQVYRYLLLQENVHELE